MTANLTNYHSHCSFCDGHAPLEEFVQAAVRMGFTSYGVSSHAPLPFPTRWTMERKQVVPYLEEIDRLKEKYGEQIELYAGMEIDYLDEASNPAIPYFQNLPLDYRIGSVHLLASSTGEIVDIDVKKEKFAAFLPLYFENDLEGLVKSYFEKLMRMVESGGFDIVGHADKMIYNAACCQPDILDRPWFGRLIAGYFTLIREKGLMVEINTKAYRNTGVFFPSRRHFALLKEMRIPVLVNSDAHYPDLINSGRSEALGALKSAGILEVMELHGNHWRSMPITDFTPA